MSHNLTKISLSCFRFRFISDEFSWIDINQIDINQILRDLHRKSYSYSSLRYLVRRNEQTSPLLHPFALSISIVLFSEAHPEIRQRSLGGLSGAALHRGPSFLCLNSPSAPPWQTVGEAGRSKRRQSPAARNFARNSSRILCGDSGKFQTDNRFYVDFICSAIAVSRCRINLTRITAPRSNSIHIHICMSDVFQPYSRSRANRTLFAIRWRDAHFDEM